jgi:hypothetical protein
LYKFEKCHPKLENTNQEKDKLMWLQGNLENYGSEMGAFTSVNKNFTK